MTVVLNPLETLDYVTATAVASPAAETAIITTDVVFASATGQGQQQGGQAGTPQATRPVIIEANVNIGTGTAATGLVVRCRQGAGTGGAVVSPASFSVTVAASTNYQLHFKWRDATGVPFAAAGTAYTITIAETSATAAGSVLAIDVEVKQ